MWRGERRQKEAFLVDPGSIKLNYYGGDAGEFYAIGNLIQDGIDQAIRDKICILPPLVRDFLREKVISSVFGIILVHLDRFVDAATEVKHELEERREPLI